MTSLASDESIFSNKSLTYRVLEGDILDRIKEIKDNSVHLIITSPPYGEIKKYSGRKGEIGHGQDLENYYRSLNKVWKECIRVLHPGCRMVINIGDEFLKSNGKRIYQIIPHHAHITNGILINNPEIVYTGDIHWSKVTKTETSGGGKIMGSVYTPRNGHFFINREYIMIFKKLGKEPKVSPAQKETAKFTLDERRQWFKDTWEIPGRRQEGHIAMFPDELPERFIRMYSFPGEVVFDPFLGSGTTLAMAAKWDRNGIGCELGYGPGEEWKEFTENKIKKHLSPQGEIIFS